MKWKGGRQSTNIEDKTLEDFTPKEGEVVMGGMFGNGPGSNQPFSSKNPKAKQWNDQVRVSKDIARRGDDVPTPTPRPSGPTDNGTHDNLVTPGKWKTKTN